MSWEKPNSWENTSGLSLLRPENAQHFLHAGEPLIDLDERILQQRRCADALRDARQIQDAGAGCNEMPHFLVGRQHLVNTQPALVAVAAAMRAAFSLVSHHF